MFHPIKDFTQRLNAKRSAMRYSRRLDVVLRDRRLAEDMGLPYNAPEPRKLSQW